ncbi:MAG: GGDEF domain-containing protein [Deltaproteobacteria bacterium]|nr:GGDEF domain-containing protein [Deltaproteobacteria bacterium]
MNLRRKTVVTVISKIGDRKPRTGACLVVIYGQNIGHRFTLQPGDILVGRSSNAQLQIDHESVSRKHGRLTFHDGTVRIEDLGSTNGTYVNDEAITERTLCDGDLIKVGRTILKYLSGDNIETAYHEEIYRLATIDGLTRCANRRFFAEQLVREVSRAQRYQRPLTLVGFDVSRFQDINDEFGHLAGDAILAQMGSRIRRRIRREDVLSRWGGGEFILLAPEIDISAGAALKARLSKIVSEGAFGFDDVPIPVSVSMASVSLSEIDIEPVDDFATDTVEMPAGTLCSQESDLMMTTDQGEDRFLLIADALTELVRDRVSKIGEDS